MKVKKLDENIRPKQNQAVRLTQSGSVYEVRYMMRTQNQSIRKLDADSYVVISTGEVLDFNHTSTRADDLQSVSRSMNRELSEVARRKPPYSDEGKRRLWIIPLHEIAGISSSLWGKQQDYPFKSKRNWQYKGEKTP